jgi:hypothetical protein
VETYAFFIVRRQREQTEMDLVLPPTEIFTLRMLGFQHLFVLRWEWETFSPNTTPLPQILHFAILDTSLNTPLWRTDIDLTETTAIIIAQHFQKCKCFFEFSLFFSK